MQLVQLTVYSNTNLLVKSSNYFSQCTINQRHERVGSFKICQNNAILRLILSLIFQLAACLKPNIKISIRRDRYRVVIPLQFLSLQNVLFRKLLESFLIIVYRTISVCTILIGILHKPSEGVKKLPNLYTHYLTHP